VNHTEGALDCAGLRARDHASKQTCNLRLDYKITAEFRRES
jgi:hypothetical protein